MFSGAVPRPREIPCHRTPPHPTHAVGTPQRAVAAEQEAAAPVAARVVGAVRACSRASIASAHAVRGHSGGVVWGIVWCARASPPCGTGPSAPEGDATAGTPQARGSRATPCGGTGPRGRAAAAAIPSSLSSLSYAKTASRTSWASATPYRAQYARTRSPPAPAGRRCRTPERTARAATTGRRGCTSPPRDRTNNRSAHPAQQLVIGRRQTVEIRQPEIEEHKGSPPPPAPPAHQHVARLDVAVHHSVRVEPVERSQQPIREVPHLPLRWCGPASSTSRSRGRTRGRADPCAGKPPPPPRARGGITAVAGRGGEVG